MDLETPRFREPVVAALRLRAAVDFLARRGVRPLRRVVTGAMCCYVLLVARQRKELLRSAYEEGVGLKQRTRGGGVDDGGVDVDDGVGVGDVAARGLLQKRVSNTVRSQGSGCVQVQSSWAETTS